LFYLYGEGQSSKSLFSQLQAAVENQQVVFNMSGGEQLRDYMHVCEVARCLVKLTLSLQSIGVINVCSGEPISIRRLVEQWIEKHNWKIQLNLGHYPYPDYEPMAFWGGREKFVHYSK
jgi:dTDP-6-deoxy-L-talose 4-dehydrogenase (NAD+)